MVCFKNLTACLLIRHWRDACDFDVDTNFPRVTFLESDGCSRQQSISGGVKSSRLVLWCFGTLEATLPSHQLLGSLQIITPWHKPWLEFIGSARSTWLSWANRSLAWDVILLCMALSVEAFFRRSGPLFWMFVFITNWFLSSQSRDKNQEHTFSDEQRFDTETTLAEFSLKLSWLPLSGSLKPSTDPSLAISS